MIQDSSRVIRNSALKLICTVAAKTNFGIISQSISSLLESTYQFHEYSIKCASVAVLHLITETQLSSVEKSIFGVFLEPLLTNAKYTASILSFVCEKTSKKHGEGGSNIADSCSKDDAISNFAIYEASVDNIALVLVAQAIIEAFQSKEPHAIEQIKRIPSSVFLEKLSALVDHAHFSKTVQNEIVQKIKSFNFPSLTDDIVRELVDGMLQLFRSEQQSEVLFKRQSSLGELLQVKEQSALGTPSYLHSSRLANLWRDLIV